MSRSRGRFLSSFSSSAALLNSVPSSNLQYSAALFLHPPFTPLSGKVLESCPWESLCVALNRTDWLLSLWKKQESWHWFNSRYDSSENVLTAFPQKPPKRRRSLIRASPVAPVTVPLSVNPAVFIIDEISMAIVLPLSLLGSYSIDSIPQTLRKLQIFPACCRPCSVPSPQHLQLVLKLMQHWVVAARGYWAELTACVSMLSISSHQAISRALSLNISSDQIDWKGAIRFELGCARGCVRACSIHRR